MESDHKLKQSCAAGAGNKNINLFVVYDQQLDRRLNQIDAAPWNHVGVSGTPMPTANKLGHNCMRDSFY
jgi:hypothetical protein